MDGGIHTTGYYVQVRYPLGERWVTVAVSGTREVAVAIAADAYRRRQNDRGRTPGQVRVISADRLRLEGGDEAIATADTDIAGQGDPDDDLEQP